MQAAHRNLTSPRYVWISHGWYSNQWWTQAVANDAINCSDTQLEAFLAKSRTLAVNHLPAPTDSNAETVAGIVSCDTTLCMQKWNRLALFQYKSASNRSELHKWRRRLSVTNYSSTVCVWQFCVKDAKDCRKGYEKLIYFCHGRLKAAWKQRHSSCTIYGSAILGWPLYKLGHLKY